MISDRFGRTKTSTAEKGLSIEEPEFLFQGLKPIQR